MIVVFPCATIFYEPVIKKKESEKAWDGWQKQVPHIPFQGFVSSSPVSQVVVYFHELILFCLVFFFLIS